VEYLLNGIPGHLAGESSDAGGSTSAAPVASVPATTPAPRSAQVQQQPTQTPASSAPQNLFQLAQQQAGGAGGNPLGGLRGPGTAGTGGGLESVRNAPGMDALRQLVAQNPQAIQPMLQQLMETNPGLVQAIGNDPERFLQILNEGLNMEEQDGQPGTVEIRLTQEEAAAIGRLEALGFPRQAVIEAYLACDKNEELAANFLFDGAFDDNP